jgi:cellulose synthase/poly-beta-1,6-N-acetylglucosamine synthase-like glycosyltransferase
MPSLAQKPARRETIGVALPGQTFCGSWVVAWTELYGHLRDRFAVEMQLVYASNVHATRWHLYNGFRDMRVRPDWLLWIDDDNLVTPNDVEQLLADLRANPDADMAAGWTWCGADTFETKAHTSIGTLGNAPAQIPYQELMAGPDDLKEIGFTGFPVVLMRGAIFDKVGPESFAPIMGSQYARGFASEDIAFCIRARAAGVKILVDRRVKVPHLKLREVQPTDLPVVMVVEQRETA